MSSGPSPATASERVRAREVQAADRRQIPVEHRPEGSVLPPFLEAAGTEPEGRQPASQQRSFGPGRRFRKHRQERAQQQPVFEVAVGGNPLHHDTLRRQRPSHQLEVLLGVDGGRSGMDGDDQVGRHDVVLPARGQQEVARVVDPHVHVRSRQQVEVDGAEERRGADHLGRQLDDVHLRAGKARRCSSGGAAPQADDQHPPRVGVEHHRQRADAVVREDGAVRVAGLMRAVEVQHTFAGPSLDDAHCRLDALRHPQQPLRPPAESAPRIERTGGVQAGHHERHRPDHESGNRPRSANCSTAGTPAPCC